MGNTNTLPVISQTKSLVQLATGDKEGAKDTQEKFFHECPIVAQATSAVEYVIDRDKEKMLETNKRSAKILSNFADGIPVVGHVKGAVHAATGDKEAAKSAIKSANRSIGVVGGGAVGFLTAGPVGAVAGGIAGGAAMDGIQTGVSSAYHKEFRPSGSIAAVKQAIDKPSGGSVFDAVAVPIFDGVAGYGAGQLTSQIQSGMAGTTVGDAALQSEAAAIAAETAESSAMAHESAVIAEAAAAGESGAGAAPLPDTGNTNIHKLAENIIAKKTDIVKAAVDPRGGSVDVPTKGAAKLGLDAIKSLPKGTKWTTVPSVSTNQLQLLLDQLKTVDKILATTKDLTALASGKQLDIMAPGLSVPFKTILTEIFRYIGASMPKREEIREKTALLAQRVRQLVTPGARPSPERNLIDRRDTLRCVHWNMADVPASLIEHLGLVWYLVLDAPDVLLLNHVTASETLMNALTDVLGYKFLKFPSPSVMYEDRDEDGSSLSPSTGSALLFRPREGIVCVGAGSEGEIRHGYGVEAVWVDVQKQEPEQQQRQNGDEAINDQLITIPPVCRLLNLQCVGSEQEADRAVDTVKRLSEGQTTVICTTSAGPMRDALIKAVGLEIVLSSSGDNSDDVVMVSPEGRQHIVCHRRRVDQSNGTPTATHSTLDNALPFTIGPNINPQRDYCTDENCHYGCCRD